MTRSFLWAIGFSLIAFSGNALAQSTALSTPITAETVIRHLQQDRQLLPGVGFRKIRLGHSFDHVARTWGPPTQRRSKLFSKTWEYRVGNGTRVILRGRKQVSSIEVEAAYDSELRSAEGARFGMATYQVVSIYGPPDRNTGDTLIYARKGIEFGFAQGALRTVKVVAPDGS